jgi:hypothetical protein
LSQQSRQGLPQFASPCTNAIAEPCDRIDVAWLVKADESDRALHLRLDKFRTEKVTGIDLGANRMIRQHRMSVRRFAEQAGLYRIKSIEFKA